MWPRIQTKIQKAVALFNSKNPLAKKVKSTVPAKGEHNSRADDKGEIPMLHVQTETAKAKAKKKTRKFQDKHISGNAAAGQKDISDSLPVPIDRVPPVSPRPVHTTEAVPTSARRAAEDDAVAQSISPPRDTSFELGAAADQSECLLGEQQNSLSGDASEQPRSALPDHHPLVKELKIRASKQTALEQEYSLLKSEMQRMQQENINLRMQAEVNAARPSKNKEADIKSDHSRKSMAAIARYGKYGRTIFAIKKIMRSRAWKISSICALLFALLGTSVFALIDVPDKPGNDILDTLMLFIMIFFLFEIVFCWIVQRSYRLSFFFWMDVAGTVSMVFEITWMLGGSHTSINPVILRTARTAKMGARIGRLFKLEKLLVVKPDAEDEVSKAKVLSQNLMFTLSTKVSILTIALVMILPLFNIPLYPTEDLSMRLWSQRLEELYNWELNGEPANIFESSLTHLKEFYQNENYQPYKVEGYQSQPFPDAMKTLQGTPQLQGTKEPNRKANEKPVEVSTCRLSRAGCSGKDKAKIYFDFTTPNQLDAAMAISLIGFMMILMIFMAFEVNRVVEQLLVAPLERMLCVVRVYAVKLLDQLRTDDDDDWDDECRDTSEIDVLELVLSKLARLVELQLTKNVIDKNDLKNMDASALAVMEMLDVKVVDASAPIAAAFKAQRAELNRSNSVIVVNQALHSWKVDVLSRSLDELQEMAFHIFWHSEVGSADECVEQAQFIAFHDVVRAGYHDLPYHCYQHACDILHTVFRILCLLQCNKWLTPVEAYALLVAALCHDLGHFGKTNPFLVETGHDLALRYNDKSPLENMHCASMYAICRDPNTDAFGKLSATSRKESRRICISSILHTDNAKHFEQVKDISQCYEMNTDACDDQAAQDSFLSNYMSEVLLKEKIMWMELFLHLADVSNPSKPFGLCKAWAWRVLDEFFQQGDEEKKLGLTVGMLNDRDKVNRPGSQHGFINFLVAPLVGNTVKIFAPLLELHEQLVTNLESWKKEWEKESQPTPEDVMKKDNDVLKLREMSDKFRSRKDRDPPVPGRRKSEAGRASLIGNQFTTGVHAMNQNGKPTKLGMCQSAGVPPAAGRRAVAG